MKTCPACMKTKNIEMFTRKSSLALSIKCRDCIDKIRSVSDRRNFNAYKPTAFDNAAFLEFMKQPPAQR